MNEKKLAFIKSWLEKAEHDYQIARILADGELVFYDEACFHCQQSVEKFFKAVIIYHTGGFKKTHDLVGLFEKIGGLDIEIKSFTKDDIANLNTYYTRTRYVSDIALAVGDARNAIKIVEKVKRFVEHDAGLEGIDFDKSWWESV